MPISSSGEDSLSDPATPGSSHAAITGYHWLQQLRQQEAELGELCIFLSEVSVVQTVRVSQALYLALSLGLHTVGEVKQVVLNRTDLVLSTGHAVLVLRDAVVALVDTGAAGEGGAGSPQGETVLLLNRLFDIAKFYESGRKSTALRPSYQTRFYPSPQLL